MGVGVAVVESQQQLLHVHPLRTLPLSPQAVDPVDELARRLLVRGVGQGLAQQLHRRVPGDKAQGGCAQPQEQKVAEVQGIYDPVQGNMKVHD